MATATEKFEVLNRWTNKVQFTAEITCAPDTSLSIKLGLAVRWAVKSGANLSGANLSGAYLSGANLSGANLSDAYLRGANLSDANLSGANLSGANLRGAYLSDADLSGADLSGAYLSGANLRGAYLSDANLSGANLSDANLSDAYLSEEALRPFKADLFLTLDSLHAGALDAQHLIAKLRAGEVDGSTYGRGGTECACLVGTIGAARGIGGEALDHNSDRPAERWFMMINPGDKPDAIDSEGKQSGGAFAAAKALEWVVDWCTCHGVDADVTSADPVSA